MTPAHDAGIGPVDSSVSHLALLRFGLGGAVLASFLPLAIDLDAFYGSRGWVSHAAYLHASHDAGWYSLFAWLGSGTALQVMYVALIVTAAAFTLGIGVRWVKWPLWLLYVSFLNRNPSVIYGADLLLAVLLLPVCFAPLGAAAGDGGRWGAAMLRTRVALRLVRWQMTVVFLFTALQKVRGEAWWQGEALWVVVNNAEFADGTLAAWLAPHSWIVTLATHAVLAFELAYPFLIWSAVARPFVVVAATLFHLATAAAFGLYLFAWVAVTGHLAFLPDDWVRRLWRLSDHLTSRSAARMRAMRTSPPAKWRSAS